MTDAAFVQGMRDLAATLPSRDEDLKVKNARGQVYRRILDHLSDEAFLFAVELALKHERWFPAPATLISFADEYEPPRPALPPARSPEAIEAAHEASRANLRGGMELVRSYLVEKGLLRADAPDPVRDMPKANR